MASSLCHHMERSHRIVLPQMWGVDIYKGIPDTYMVSFPPVLKLVACTVDGFLERANCPGRRREHFMYWHWKLKVPIIQEGSEPLPRCNHCGMLMPVAQLVNHRRTAICEKATETHIRRRDVDMVERCGEM